MATASSAGIQDLLSDLWDQGGTDLLLTAGSPPLFRIDGKLTPTEHPVLSEADTEKLVRGMLADEQVERLLTRRDVDFSFNWEGKARYRGNAFFQKGTFAVALRLIPIEIPTFQQLGLPPIVEDFVNLPYGLVLVTGPTGSGKSTTLASMIEYINRHRACHILTIEDPIEYVHHHQKSAVNQREIGDDAETFEHALRAALREDPDVILVGEMRDLESIQIALTIAETGHLVFATLHTNDTAQALDRIIDVFPAERRAQIEVQLSGSLAGIIYQRLLPRPEVGMVAAFEVLVANNAVRNLIREGKTRQLRNVITTSQSEGMHTLEMSLSDLVAAGEIDYETAKSASLFPKEITRPLSAAAVASAAAQAAASGGRRGRRRG
jgi:twitching motility protein PilT